MRVAVVYHKWVSDGGLERYLLGFVNALIERGGYGVTVATASADEAASASVRGRAEIVLLPGGRVRSGGDLRRFDSQAAEFAASGKFDVVLGFGRTTRQHLHRAGGGCHQVYSRMLPAHRRLSPKNRAELDLERQLYTGGGTRCYVVNSHMVAGELQDEYGVDPAAVEVVYTAVDSERFSPAQEPAPVGARPVLLYAAREHRRKGLATLLESIAGLDVDLRVAGPEPKGALRVALARAGGTHIGEPDSMPDAYRAADFFVHPTRYDACANTVLQSMACGVPGIISSRDGASQFVRDGENGILLEEPEEPDALREAIVRALSLSDGERVSLGVAARATVEPLTWEAHVQRWVDLMEKVKS